MLKANVAKFLRLAQLAPYGLDANKERLLNVRSARTLIELCHELKIEPRQLIDVGANNSQWAYWLRKEWPWLNIESVEPSLAFQPIGTVHRFALSQRQGTATLKQEYGATHISADGNESVKMTRGDLLPIKLLCPSILKVDCENFTADALESFGLMLHRFDIIVVEMWNHYPGLPQWKYQQADIWKLMLKHGKSECRVIDADLTMYGVPFYDAAFFSPR